MSERQRQCLQRLVTPVSNSALKGGVVVRTLLHGSVGVSDIYSGRTRVDCMLDSTCIYSPLSGRWVLCTLWYGNSQYPLSHVWLMQYSPKKERTIDYTDSGEVCYCSIVNSLFEMVSTSRRRRHIGRFANISASPMRTNPMDVITPYQMTPIPMATWPFNPSPMGVQ